MAVTPVHVTDQVLENIEKEYSEDEQFKEIFEKPIEPYKKVGKRLYFENRLCIPKGNTRKTILHDNHESLLGAHRGFKKTLKKIKEHFFWSGMNKEIYEYIKTCKKYQEGKSSNQKPIGNATAVSTTEQKIGRNIYGLYF